MPTILIVDDDPAIRRVLNLILEAEGFTVHTATNGLDAIRCPMLLTGKVDLVITDIMMPEMNGLALAECLTAQQPRLPVLFLSGSLDYLDIGSSRAAEILTKPFDSKALLNSVRRLLSRRASPAVA